MYFNNLSTDFCSYFNAWTMIVQSRCRNWSHCWHFIGQPPPFHFLARKHKIAGGWYFHEKKRQLALTHRKDDLLVLARNKLWCALHSKCRKLGRNNCLAAFGRKMRKLQQKLANLQQEKLHCIAEVNFQLLQIYSEHQLHHISPIWPCIKWRVQCSYHRYFKYQDNSVRFWDMEFWHLFGGSQG